MAFIASHLTSKDEKRDLEKIFKSMDKDGNGTLDREEVLAGYEEHFGVAITEEMVDAMFAAVDLDGNNCIDYTEFVMATMNRKSVVAPRPTGISKRPKRRLNGVLYSWSWRWKRSARTPMPFSAKLHTTPNA